MSEQANGKFQAQELATEERDRERELLLTVSVHVRMGSEAVLHGFELFYAVHALWFSSGEHEAGERLAEFGATGSMSHPAQARTVPVNFTRLRVESAAVAAVGFRGVVAAAAVAFLAFLPGGGGLVAGLITLITFC